MRRLELTIEDKNIWKKSTFVADFGCNRQIWIFGIFRASAKPAYAGFLPVNVFPVPVKKNSRRYQVPTETERFVRLARDHTLYPGSWSNWKLPLPLNKITSGDVQQAKTVNAKTFTAIGNKTELDYSL